MRTAVSARQRLDALLDATDSRAQIRSAAHSRPWQLDDELAALMATYADRSHATESPPLARVGRSRARALRRLVRDVPALGRRRSARSGTFREACSELPRIADLGFDVVYLPPIHPIGTQLSEGAEQQRCSRRPATPAARGRSDRRDGGHTAVEPGLGTLDDFDRVPQEAERLGLEVALDLAWQCSPDHPWVREHPEWFRHRPDGTIKYAENPPKKYQDIYPLDFDCEDWRALWHALLDVTRFWIARGVRIFRVDNPHTKTFGFWEWLIDARPARAPGRDLPRRGVHAAEGDALSREGRLHAVVHLLHVAEHEGGARPSTSPS